MSTTANTIQLSTLTVEQVPIVEASPESCILITAGPGTGKTHTLIARLSCLITSHGISPGQELLVLSFSRAAVYELRQRVATVDGDTRYVRAYTFDSFATQLLLEFGNTDDLSAWSFDERIEQALTLIKRSTEVKHRLSMYRHIMIDEVQDLVGIRCDFVLAILHAVQCGFTVFGDPAQGIYTFQLSKAERLSGAATFYNTLRREFVDSLQVHSLTINHRAASKPAQAALWAGNALNQPSPNYKNIKSQLNALIETLPRLGRLEDSIEQLDRPSITTAILCRTNGQALVVSRELWKVGVAHHLQRRATDRVIPSWVAISLRGMDDNRVPRKLMMRQLENMELPYATTPYTAWRILKRLDGSSGEMLDLNRITERIRLGAVSDELIDYPKVDLIVSTVHRAKGREFDRVIVASPDDRDDLDLAELAEETRILYVALTRPRSELLQIIFPGMRSIFKHDSTNRWVRRYRHWEYKEFEVRGDDSHSTDPAGGYLINNINSIDTQDYLLNSVRIGDPVILSRIQVPEDGILETYYVIIHNDRPIGITSKSFGRDLYQTLKINHHWTINWPIHIHGIFVDGVDTVAGTNTISKRCGLGCAGVWLRARVSGLGRFQFEKLQR